jgi:hypothetical protein
MHRHVKVSDLKLSPYSASVLCNACSYIYVIHLAVICEKNLLLRSSREVGSPRLVSRSKSLPTKCNLYAHRCSTAAPLKLILEDF